MPAGSGCGNPDASVSGPDASVSGPDASVGDPSLSGLSVSNSILSPAFSPATTVYAVKVPFWVDAVQVTATAVDRNATLQINGVMVASGAASAPIGVGAGPTMITVLVQAPGEVQKSYDLVLMRSPSGTDYLKASNTEANDRFGGSSISLSGDTLAVGAYGEAGNATGVNGNQADNSALTSGAVYVYR